MKQVRKHLFIGNFTDATAVMNSLHLNIGRMLSLLSKKAILDDTSKPDTTKPDTPKPAPTSRYSIEKVRTPTSTPSNAPVSEKSVPAPKGNESDGDSQSKNDETRELVRMTVPLRDMESENLLDHLEDCLAFVEEGIKTGDVLVHCLAGISRSASVVTAYLMRTEKLSVDDALASLREASPSVCPNDGFMEQLKMFEDMGFKVDRDSAIYKQFYVSNLGTAFAKGEQIVPSRYASDPGADSATVAESLRSQLILSEENRVATLYRCKKCRRLVASETNVIPHSSRLDEPVFKSKRKGGGRSDGDDFGKPGCSSIFVEPMQWMTSVNEGLVEGKLFCATCQARLGNFHWAGVQCSCGAWVNPAFQLHKSRLDLTWI